MEYDLFISHASEDKTPLVAPLANLLAKSGVKVWYDEFTLRAGDSLSRSIDRGLADAKHGLVILSKNFLRKPWPEYELRGLISREIGREKVIIPIWFGISHDDILTFSPPLADKFALNASSMELPHLAIKIIEIVRPDIHDNIYRRWLWLDRIKKGKIRRVKRIKLINGPIRHATLPISMRTRSAILVQVLTAVSDITLDGFLLNLRRDMNPWQELEIWEAIAAGFLEFRQCRDLSDDAKREAFTVLLRCSMRMLPEPGDENLKVLTDDEVLELASLFIRFRHEDSEVARDS